MLSRQFLSWANRAPAGERAEATAALAKAYLYADLDRIERGEMERALTCLLDDASPLVRRSMAEALAGAVDAPHHLVSALAADQADIAAVVLARSPVLTDAELIDAAAVGEAPAQCAIAGRPVLSAAVAGALAEVGGLDALLVLCRNDGAAIADLSVRRILERFGEDGALREALGARRDLSRHLRHELVLATAEALRRFVVTCGWVAPERARRIAAEAGDRAAITLAEDRGARDGDAGQGRFVAYLSRAGRLTPALVLRALLSGQTGLVEAAFAELSGQPLGRVAGLVRHSEGLGFAALYRKTGLPEAMLPVFRTALAALHRLGATSSDVALRRRVVAEVLAACGAGRDHPLAGLTALLRRFEAEAARDEVRAAETARDEPRVPAWAEAPPPAGSPRRIEPRLAVADLQAAA